jgi:hypothetical protein
MDTAKSSDWIGMFNNRLFDTGTPQGRAMATEIERNGGRFIEALSETLDDAVSHLPPEARPKAKAMIAFGCFTNLTFTTHPDRNVWRVNASAVRSAFRPFVRREARDFLRDEAVGGLAKQFDRLFDISYESLLSIDSFERSMGNGWLKRLRNRKQWQDLFAYGVILSQLCATPVCWSTMLGKWVSETGATIDFLEDCRLETTDGGRIALGSWSACFDGSLRVEISRGAQHAPDLLTMTLQSDGTLATKAAGYSLATYRKQS